MANINSLTTNSSSGMTNLYGTRNVLSGLASGMDTESMIENSVSGYKTKITQLEKEQTKYQWKQDAYRSITDKVYDLTQKYTSYTSKTNLLSNAFFSNSISTTAVDPTGAISSGISANGRSSSDIQILAAEAATASRYSVSADALGLNSSNTVTQGIKSDWTDSVSVGKLKGTMTLNYDGKKINITFDESDVGIGSDMTLAEAIQKKLEDATINTAYGSKKASEVISVSEEGGNLIFKDTGGQGANPYISHLDSSLKTELGATESELYSGSRDRKYTLSNADGTFTGSKTAAEYLADKDINVTVDGVTKSFRLNKDDIIDHGIGYAFNEALQSVGMGNVTASAKTDSNGDPTGELEFSVNNGSSQFSISAKDAKVNELLGFRDGISNHLSEKTSIGTLLGDDFFNSLTETNGKYELQINGKSIYVSKDLSLESVLDNISSSDMGVNASYSKLTGKLVFAAKETGENGNISFDNDLAQKLFTATDVSGNQVGRMESGKNATIRALVNGEAVTLNRASNTFDMDGMSVTLKGNIGDVRAYKGTDATAIGDADTANAANAVSFSTSSGSDDLIKTIKEFVDEYNAIMKGVRDAYATQPAEKSAKNHTRYEPLSDDDKKGMSEKAIESYEAKAKQGILFGDSDLRALYEKLANVISPGGNEGAALRNMGIETTYSNGLTQIKLDENKLRDALSKNPDSVRNAFTKSKDSGASTDGLMTSIKKTMELYASASYASPGILVKKAGSTHNATSLLNNDMQKQVDNVQKKIEQWQTKMGSKIDYYTRQFTALEKLMNTMNSQSSALAGLMGG